MILKQNNTLITLCYAFNAIGITDVISCTAAGVATTLEDVVVAVADFKRSESTAGHRQSAEQSQM